MAFAVARHRRAGQPIHPGQMMGEHIRAFGHDAGFLRGRAIGIGDDSGQVHAPVGQQRPQPLSRVIFSQQARHHRPAAQTLHIAGGIGRAAGHVFGPRLFQHWHRRFPAQAAHPPDEIFVQHQISHDKHAQARELGGGKVESQKLKVKSGKLEVKNVKGGGFNVRSSTFLTPYSLFPCFLLPDLTTCQANRGKSS